MESKNVKYNYQLKCITCGKVFYSNRSTAKYCCSFCKNQQQRIQKGEKIRFSEDGLIITKAKQYEQRKTDKHKIPDSAKLLQYRTYKGISSGNINTQWEVFQGGQYKTAYLSEKEREDILLHANKEYYIYFHGTDKNKYRLVKLTETKGYDEYHTKLSIDIYEWEKKVYKNNGGNKRYYDREFEVVDF